MSYSRCKPGEAWQAVRHDISLCSSIAGIYQADVIDLCALDTKTCTGYIDVIMRVRVLCACKPCKAYLQDHWTHRLESPSPT